MLAKMPQQNLKTAKSGVINKLVTLLIILIVGLGLGAVYTMIPLLQTTEPVYLTANLTNNTTTHAPNAVHIKKTNNNPTNSTKIQTTTKNSTQNVPKAVSTSQKVTKTN
jgi:hypothetical protein